MWSEVMPVERYLDKDNVGVGVIDNTEGARRTPGS